MWDRYYEDHLEKPSDLHPADIEEQLRQEMEEKGSLLTPVLLVAHEFEKNLFGALTLDPYVRFETGMRIGGIVKQLSQLLQEYEIE